MHTDNAAASRHIEIWRQVLLEARAAGDNETARDISGWLFGVSRILIDLGFMDLADIALEAAVS